MPTDLITRIQAGYGDNAEVLRAHTPEYQAALDTAWRAVDALGGVNESPDPHACGYAEALDDACAAIEKLGARDPDQVRAELRKALQGVLWMASEWYDHNGYAAMNSEDYRAELDNARAILRTKETPSV